MKGEKGEKTGKRVVVVVKAVVVKAVMSMVMSEKTPKMLKTLTMLIKPPIKSLETQTTWTWKTLQKQNSVIRRRWGRRTMNNNLILLRI